jgi:hypothetical protein
LERFGKGKPLAPKLNTLRVEKLGERDPKTGKVTKGDSTAKGSLLPSAKYMRESGIATYLTFNNVFSAKIDPIFAGRLAYMSKALSLSPTITSGYRSTEDQRALYNLFLQGIGQPANAPTTSWHEYGMAVDWHDPRVLRMSNADLAVYGLVKPCSEAWHIQPIELQSSATNRAKGQAYLNAFYV